MARSIPEYPNFESPAEKKVWKVLVEELSGQCTVIHGASINHQGSNLEADFIIVWPGVGIVFIEVKGGYIRLNGNKWSTTNAQGIQKPIEPDNQARTVGHAFKELYNKTYERSLHFGWLVVFPDTKLAPGTETNECPNRHIVDKIDLGGIRDSISTVAKQGRAERNASKEECDDFVQIVIQNALVVENFIDAAQNRAYAVNAATHEHADLLRIARAIPSYVVEGPAGTGKTTMALQKAHELVSANKKVALICYSKGLSKYLQREVSKWQGVNRPTFTGTFHQMVDFWGGKTPEIPNQDWWEEGAVEEMRSRLGKRNNLELFDAIVIDEGQDFRDSWWEVIHSSFRTEFASTSESDSANLYIFGDSQQSIFGHSHYKQLPHPRLTLDVNLRNTEAIAEVVDLLTDIEVQKLGPIGPPIQHLPADGVNVVEKAEAVVTELLQEGWEPGNIALLTTGSRHVENHKTYFDAGEVDVYWKRYFDSEEVFYSTVQLFKGLERPVVVLAINGWKREDLIEEFFYVGLSRARDLLIIVGEIPRQILEKIEKFIVPYEKN